MIGHRATSTGWPRQACRGKAVCRKRRSSSRPTAMAPRRCTAAICRTGSAAPRRRPQGLARATGASGGENRRRPALGIGFRRPERGQSRKKLRRPVEKDSAFVAATRLRSASESTSARRESRWRGILRAGPGQADRSGRNPFVFNRTRSDNDGKIRRSLGNHACLGSFQSRPRRLLRARTAGDCPHRPGAGGGRSAHRSHRARAGVDEQPWLRTDSAVDVGRRRPRPGPAARSRKPASSKSASG